MVRGLGEAAGLPQGQGHRLLALSGGAGGEEALGERQGFPAVANLGSRRRGEHPHQELGERLAGRQTGEPLLEASPGVRVPPRLEQGARLGQPRRRLSGSGGDDGVELGGGLAMAAESGEGLGVVEPGDGVLGGELQQAAVDVERAGGLPRSRPGPDPG